MRCKLLLPSIAFLISPSNTEGADIDWIYPHWRCCNNCAKSSFPIWIFYFLSKKACNFNSIQKSMPLTPQIGEISTRDFRIGSYHRQSKDACLRHGIFANRFAYRRNTVAMSPETGYSRVAPVEFDTGYNAPWPRELGERGRWISAQDRIVIDNLHV